MSARIISLAGVRAARRPRYRPEPVDPRRFARFVLREPARWRRWEAEHPMICDAVALVLAVIAFYSIWLVTP